MAIEDYIRAYKRGDIMPFFDPVYSIMRNALKRTYGTERRRAILMRKFGAVYPQFKKRRKPLWIVVSTEKGEKIVIRNFLKRTSRTHVYEKSTNTSWADYNNEPYVLIRFDAKNTRVDRFRAFYKNIRTWVGFRPFARPLSYEKRKTAALIDPRKYRFFVVSNAKPRFFKKLFKVKRIKVN